jgi:hypothetical protein
MKELNRREFAESVMTAALVPLLGTGMAPLPSGWWQAASAGAGMTPGLTPGLEGDLEGVARSLAGVVRAQYGDRLSEAEITTITRQIRSALERAEQMRRIDLANGDEPDFVFSAPGDPPR